MVCMLQTCFITGPRFSELKEQRLGLILILTDKRCLRLFAVDSTPFPGPRFRDYTGKNKVICNLKKVQIIKIS